MYDYAVTAAVSALLDAPPACGRQARSFVLAGALIAGQSLNPATPLAFGFDASFEDFLGLSNLDLGGVGRVGARGVYNPSQLSTVVQESAAAVGHLAAVSARVTSLREQTEASVLRAAQLGDAEPIGPLLEAIQQRLDAEEQGLGEAARVPVVIRDLVGDAPADLPGLFAAAAAVRADSLSGATAQSVLDLAATAQAAIDTTAKEAVALQILVDQVDDALEATRQQVTVRPGDDLREVAIEIRASKDSLVSVVPTRTRTVRAYLGPRPSRGFGCAVAVALTFASRPADYDVRDGALVDDRTDGMGTAPAVLFEVAPPAIGPVLGLVGGVGLGSTESLAPDLYLGGSFRLFSPILLVSGAVWRRGRALPNGLALGDVVDASDDFSRDAFLDALPREWRPSFFVGLSVVP